MKGKRIDLSAWKRTPAHLRMGYTVLKNAGLKPPELQARGQIAEIRARLTHETDPDQKLAPTNKLNALMVTNSIRMERLSKP
jgi:hypothetical protein